LKLLNVYYWTNKLFDRLATLGYKPQRRLTVLVDRDLADLSAGKRMTNNAFFTDADWSLSFLPVKSSFIYSILGLKIHSPALDPSVAMHECSHSVFQVLIGSIINPSLMGLHEAFADYFAMSVLETRQIGIIFNTGKALRTTLDADSKTKTTYAPGLEEHDSGNIINTALQHIRELSTDKNFMDRVAVATIKSLAQYPYITPAQVQSAFMAALARQAEVENKVLAPTFTEQAQQIWATYKIQAPESYNVLHPSFFVNAFDLRGYFDLSITVRATEKLMRDWNLPAQTHTLLHIRKVSEGPQNSMVLYVEVETDSGARLPLWIHMSAEGVLGAYDPAGNIVTPQSQPGLFAELVKINTQLSSIVSLVSHNGIVGTTIANLFENATHAGAGADVGNLYKAKNQKVSVQKVTFKSLGTVEVTQRSADIRPKILGRLVNILVEGQLSALHSGTVYTVKASDFPQLKTPEVFPGERLIGYESSTRAGLSTKVVISDFDSGKNTQVLPEPPKKSEVTKQTP
jgi:hypothetical protein